MEDVPEYENKLDKRGDRGHFAKGNQAAKMRGPNRVSIKVKESIVNFLENNIDAVQESFDTLKPKEKLEFISNILPYAAPKLSSVQVEANANVSLEDNRFDESKLTDDDLRTLAEIQRKCGFSKA